MTRSGTFILGLVSFFFATSPAAAYRHHRYERRPALPQLESYTTFKLGGYSPDAHGAGDGGMFLGAEWGISPAPVLETGLTVDWFHRASERGDVVRLNGPYDLPVEVRTGQGTSTDLVPIGGVVRARFPLGDGRVAAFVAGHLTYDVLRLDAHGTPLDGPGGTLSDTEWFGGFGTGVSGGLQAEMAPGVGLVFEAGFHDSDPTRHVDWDGIPAEARVRASGEYLRAGARFSF
jgi:hypothetical protein